MNLLVKAHRALVVVGITATATIGVAGPASAEPYHDSKMAKSWAPWTTPWSQGPQYYTLPTNLPVRMICWTTGASREGTSKWFKINSLNYPIVQNVYVPANVVGAQWYSSPPC